MKAIAAVDVRMGIGKNGGLLVHNKEDMKFFKDMTMGKTVIMGRKTFDSIGGPLIGRDNVVLTKTGISFNMCGKSVKEKTSVRIGYIDDGRIITSDGAEIEEDVFIIGGGEIYSQFISKCDTIYLTEYTDDFQADTFFPDFDKSLYDVIDIQSGDGYVIREYTRK